MYKRAGLLLLCLVLAAQYAVAGRTITTTWIANEDVQTIDLGLPTRGEGIMGNANAPDWSISNFVYGAEGYKYLFYPPQFAHIGCSMGFWVEKVHMVLQFGEEDVPSSFDVRVDLEDAQWNSGTLCWEPGVQDCLSQTFTVQIDSAGVYDIAVPLEQWCNCGYLDYYYLMGFFFLTEFEPNKFPGLVCDSFPGGCKSYNDFGLGWEDLVSAYPLMPGELVMWADINCCDYPVSESLRTWGSVKSLYR